MRNMPFLGLGLKVIVIWALALPLLIGAIAGDVADVVYGESSVTYDEGHPTAYGGGQG
jgi:hypothetical protein